MATEHVVGAGAQGKYNMLPTNEVNIGIDMLRRKGSCSKSQRRRNSRSYMVLPGISGGAATVAAMPSRHMPAAVGSGDMVVNRRWIRAAEQPGGSEGAGGFEGPWVHGCRCKNPAVVLIVNTIMPGMHGSGAAVDSKADRRGPATGVREAVEEIISFLFLDKNAEQHTFTGERVLTAAGWSESQINPIDARRPLVYFF